QGTRQADGNKKPHSDKRRDHQGIFQARTSNGTKTPVADTFKGLGVDESQKGRNSTQHRSQCNTREYQSHGASCSTNCTNEADRTRSRGYPDKGRPTVAIHTATAEYSCANGDGKACASVNAQNSGVS